MTLRAALIIAIDLLREQGDRDPSFAKAEKVLQKKAGKIGERMARIARRRPCPRCRRSTDNVICISCWHEAPYQLRVHFTQAKTDEVKRAAIRELLEWAKSSNPLQEVPR